jgi:hypothetical protein
MLFMPFCYYFFSFIVLSIIGVLIRSLVLWKKNIPVALFLEALRNENSGHFEEAVITYEIALNEFKKIGSHSNLKIKIIDKLKVLDAVIEYKKTLVPTVGRRSNTKYIISKKHCNEKAQIF